MFLFLFCEGVVVVIWILCGVDIWVFFVVYVGICSCIFLRGRWENFEGDGWIVGMERWKWDMGDVWCFCFLGIV